jgi:hypothetical protein
MKKLIISVIFATLLATPIFAITDQDASDLNSTPGIISGSEQIGVTVEAYVALPNFDVNGDATYETNNSNVAVHITASGAGTITIKDQNGNVLWQYEKTTNDEEDFYPEVTLPNGVGDYTLTATITNGLGQSDSKTIIVTYSPTIPAPPNTGYYYFSGYAVSVTSTWTFALLLAALLATIIFRLARRKPAKTK